MTQFKAIATITWKFESDESLNDCLEYAKGQLDNLMKIDPYGEEYDGFGIQMDIAAMKERKRLIHLAEFAPEDVFPYITKENTKRDYKAGDETYVVRMNSDRYFVFQNNHFCVSCGLEGTKMVLDLNPGDQSPHFNLYGEENGRLVLMTKDHITPKSRGGEDKFENYATMCSTCNNLKGAYDLSTEQVYELRLLYNNKQKLPRKELRDLINELREEMVNWPV